MDFLRKQCAVIITAALFVINLLVIQFTDLDLLVQDKVYNFTTHKWLLEDIHAEYGWLFYKGIKVALIGFALLIIFSLIASFQKHFASLRKYRRGFVCILLSMMLCPLIASGAKQITNVYCPYEIERYGGKQPYVKPLSCYPEKFKQEQKGLGFPAGHAAGGFALFSLFFFFESRRHKILFGSLGMLVGVFMATYQILRGQHYVGDTLVTVFGSLLLNFFIFHIFSNQSQGLAGGLREIKIK